MKKIRSIWLVILLFLAQSLAAQYYYFNDKYYANEIVVELGVNAGIMNALTDLGGKKGIGKGFIKDLNWKNSRPAFGIYAMGVYKDVIGLRLEASFGQIAAYDSILKDVKASTFGRYERNLSFKSRITEFQLGLELHPFYFLNFEEGPPPLSPYLVGAVSFFSFDPQAKLNGQWYALHPLRTEGQGFREYPDNEPYKLNQVNFAAGIGVKYEINSFLHTKLEINHRFLRTDYLDDVSTSYIDPSLFDNYLSPGQASIARQLFSRKAELTPGELTVPGSQRGNPENNDAYFTIMLKIGITLGRQQR